MKQENSEYADSTNLELHFLAFVSRQENLKELHRRLITLTAGVGGIGTPIIVKNLCISLKEKEEIQA